MATPDFAAELLITDFATHGASLSQVRHQVFVVEQGVPQAMEIDEDDQQCMHALLCLDGIPIGTGRLLGSGKLGRIAVLAAYRGRGFGRCIVKRLEEEAKTRGMSHTFLHSQLTAQAFYRKLGYQARGRVFLDANIEHIEMIKSL